MTGAPRRTRVVVREDCATALLEALDRALEGDRTALDRVWGALPPHLAVELTWHWHCIVAERAEERRRG